MRTSLIVFPNVIAVTHLFDVQVNLERQQQGEQELVLLVQTARRVSEHLKRQVFNDAGDSLGGDGRLGRPVHGDVEEAEELRQRRLVHAVHHTHLGDQEIEDAAAGGHGSELFTRGGNLDLCLRRNLKHTRLYHKLISNILSC